MMVIVLIAMMVSIEFILAACAVFSHVAIAVDMSFVHSIVPAYQRTFKPQRNLLLYGLWMGWGSAVFLGLRWFVHQAKERQSLNLKLFLTVHMILAFLMGHAAFEIVAMGNPIWAWPVFWGAFAVAVGVCIFWPEFLVGISLLKKYYASWRIPPWLAAAIGCLVIFLVVYMPDLQAVVALVFMGEYFHNWDVDLFGAVYAITHGLIPGVDVITTYGFGVSVMAAKLVNLMGGFGYAKLLGIIMWVGIIYYVLWFLLMRRFLASSLLALAAILFAIRMQMFNLALEPFIWAAVMSTVFRCCFDVGVFWMIGMHMQTRRIFFLGMGAFIVSLGLYYLLTTGMHMFLVFSLYVIVSAFMPCLGGGQDRLRWRNHAIVIASVFAWTGLWFYLTVGAHIKEPTFWYNLVEYNSYFIRGIFSDLLTTPILGNNYVLGIGGLLYPVFYLTTFLYIAGRVMDGKADGRDVFAGLLAFYGLEIHSYYIARVSQWYTIGLPGILLVFYWLTKGLQKAPAYWRQRVAWGLLLTALFCLMTDRLFVGYPNLLNFSHNPIVDSRTAFRVGPGHIPYFNQLLVSFPEAFKLPLNSLGEKDEQLKFDQDFANDEALKAYYARQTALPEDTALIRRLTSAGDRVALLSSFEVTLLNNADRKPFFYYFPLINSRPLTGRNFMVTEVLSYPQVQKILDQLETQKPPYIFMERIFLTPQVPQAYFYDFPDLITLIRYVLSRYEPVEVGKYLVAMKRK